MLVLSRRAGEKVMIGDDIVITIIRDRNDQMQIGIDAPKHIPVHREEVYARLREDGQGRAGIHAK